MEVGLVEEHTCGTREAVLVSQSIPLLKEFSPIKFVDNDDKEKGKICEHFSIRGYVADIRKKNPEICWPFSMLHNHKLDEYANLFPPLPESKFQRWNCEHCLHGIDPSAAVVVNGAEGLCQNDELKCINTSFESAILVSQSGEQSLLPGFQQISEGKMLGEQLLAADSSMSVSNVESYLKVCPATKENESVVKDLTEGLDIPKAGHDTCEVFRNLASDIVATKGREHSGEGINTSFESVSLVSQSGEQSLLPSFQQISEGKMLGEQLLAADSSMSVSNVESYLKVCPATKENESVVKDLTEGLDIPKAGHDTCEVFRNLASDIVATKGREHSGEGTMVLTTNTFGTAHGESTPDLLHAKTMSIESVHEISSSKMTADVAISGQKQYNDIAQHVLDIDSMELDASNQDSCNNDMDETEYTSQTKKRARETLIADKHPRKARKVRLLDDIMRSGGLDIMSKQICSPREKVEDGRNEDYNDRQPYTCKGKYIDQKSHLVDEKTQAEPSMSRARHTPLLNEDKGPSMYCLKRARKKVMTHKGHTKFKPKRTTNASSGKRLDCFHDVSGAKVRKSKFFLQRKKKGMPRCPFNPQQKAMNGINLSDSEDAATNIPYAKAIDHQFKGFLVSPQASHYGPKIRDNSHTKDSMHKNKDKAPQVGVGGYCQMHLSKELKRVPKKKRTGRVSKKVVDDDIPMDIVELLARNQHQRRLMEAKAATTPKSIDRYSLDAADGHGKLVADAVPHDISQQINLSCNTVTYLGNSRIAGQSPHSAKYTSRLDLNKDVRVSPIGPSAVPEYRIHPSNPAESLNYFSANNYPNKSSSRSRERLPTTESCRIDHALGRKSHGLSWMPVNLNVVTHEGGNQKLVNQDDSRLLNITEQAESSINRRTFAAATSFVNETIPPIHLLKLMNSVAWPGTSRNSVDTNKSGFIESSYSTTNQRCHGFTGRVEIPQANASSSFVETQRPLPRVGVFGSFLQKEIASRANTGATQIGLGIGRMYGQQTPISGNENTRLPLSNRGTLFGDKIGNFDHSKSFETKGKAKSASSHIATSSRLLNDRTPIYTNGNINHMSPDVNSITRDMIQVNINSAAAVQPPKTEICVMNRNPADFTILEEDNVYMMPCEGPGPRNSNDLANRNCSNLVYEVQRQKMMKLIALSKLSQSYSPSRLTDMS